MEAERVEYGAVRWSGDCGYCATLGCPPGMTQQMADGRIVCAGHLHLWRAEQEPAEPPRVEPPDLQAAPNSSKGLEPPESVTREGCPKHGFERVGYIACDCEARFYRDGDAECVCDDVDKLWCPDCGAVVESPVVVIYDRRLPAEPGHVDTNHRVTVPAEAGREQADALKLALSCLREVRRDYDAPINDVIREVEAAVMRPSVTREQVERARKLLQQIGDWRLDKGIEKFGALRRVVIAAGLDPDGEDVAWLDRYHGWFLSKREQVDEALAALGSPVEDEEGER